MQLKNAKVLVTGADGFIGSHLVEMLAPMVAKVRALSYYNSFNYWGWLEDVNCKDTIEVVSGDIRDPHFCQDLVKDMDVIFNVAALIAIPYSYIAPDSYVDTNIKGTLNICQAAMKCKVQRIVQFSTSEVYGTAKYVPINEEHPLQPQSPYSASKIGSDAMAMSFYNSFGLPIVIARPFNTYGPRQSSRAVIPNIIAQAVEGKSNILLGDLRPTRDFNYVLDTCAAVVALAECDLALGQVVNVGSGAEISIGDLFRKICSIVKSKATVASDAQRVRPEKSEVLRLVCDNTKLRNLTGFVPKYDLDKGLEQTVTWFKNRDNLKKYKTNIYNI